MKYRNWFPERLFPVLPIIIIKKINPDRPTLDFFWHVTVNTHIFFLALYMYKNYMLMRHFLPKYKIRQLIFYIYILFLTASYVIIDWLTFNANLSSISATGYILGYVIVLICTRYDEQKLVQIIDIINYEIYR
jgi:membrane-bound acyltransferase YfiQ involved in biofilm formation